MLCKVNIIKRSHNRPYCHVDINTTIVNIEIKGVTNMRGDGKNNWKEM